ncbi:hypothetical protein LOTGIDRAFT_183671 [Lottia gigantea]|uniref:Transmembrane protein 9 n=1 Tax=Lottia gigantea TaxID=225164 RepID=V3Z8J9_LOTGI|nr:hypothetical protein LOTGIDRAFT_183671 [Lottia gigantea]ESO87238.1 hypothetical protein LOTGIDRAFT_183671 [Lottia gigantea]
MSTNGLRCVYFIVTFLFVIVPTAWASFEDMRCKCVCPRTSASNSSVTTQAVYISDNFDPNLCSCDYVVSPQNPQVSCARCECKYESRNTTTIKVVVIFIICVVSLLFVYMLFLLCLDPLITHRPTRYVQHADEEDDPQSSYLTSVNRPMQGDRSIINRVTNEQKKWKGTVQEQRRNIYDRHAMLN